MSVFAFNSASGSSTRSLFYSAIILSILTLSGCGGGGGGSTPPGGEPTNQNPVATDDTSITNQATAVIVNVISNDADPDGILQNSSINIVSAPANGSSTANPSGTVTYTPNAGFTGPTDTFTYTVKDAQNAVSNTATVTITVNATPIAVDDNELTNQATPINVNVIANDNDPNDIVQANSITITSMPANGSATANANGTVTYTPNGGFTGPTDSFTYTITDALNVVSNIATSTIQINATPVATDDTAFTPQATPAIINVIANDNDTDGTIQADSILIITMPANGTAIANADGTVTYTPNGGFTGPTDSFTYSVTDNLGSTSNTATVTVDVNIAPVAADDNAATPQGAAIDINVIANDTDADGTIQANSILIISMPTDGTAVANANGTVTYTPNAPFTGPTDSFTYTVNDNDGTATNVASVTITINARPVANDDVDLTNQATAVIVNVIANDTDSDGSIQADSVTVAASPANGGAVANADGTITYTPNPAFTGPTDTFTYTVSDNLGAISSVATVTVNINLEPIAAGSCSTTPQQTLLTGGTLPASDPDNTPGGLTFSLDSDGSAGVGPWVTTNGTVTITNATTGAFTYLPAAHPAPRGTHTFAYRVEDTNGGAGSGTMTVIVDPKIMPLGDSITQGIENSFTPALASRIGYRKTLYTGLIADGFSIDFVGSRSIGATAGGFDTDTDSFAGAKDEEIASGSADIDDEPGVNIATTGIFDMLEANPTDIILLHIGTNDVAAGIPELTATDVQTLMTEIDRWEDSMNGNPVSVVLARIIDQCTNFPTDCGTGNADVITYNNAVAAMAGALTPANGPDEIIIINQREPLLNAGIPDMTLYANSLHPNATGYNLMAAKWQENLNGVVDAPAILVKCP